MIRYTYTDSKLMSYDIMGTTVSSSGSTLVILHRQGKWYTIVSPGKPKGRTVVIEKQPVMALSKRPRYKKIRMPIQMREVDTDNG